ncbi:MAG: hypothetical protein DCC64_06530 [Planctomycetota bacterium]|nr:MAG: hypothetical protein DCC64_06530 [Planctomycetota bacterium]
MKVGPDSLWPDRAEKVAGCHFFSRRPGVPDTGLPAEFCAAAVASASFGPGPTTAAGWVALSGDPEDINTTDRELLKLFPRNKHLANGSDAIAHWPILNASINTASGTTWVSFHHGGETGIGHWVHAGQVIVRDGSKAADERIERVLTAYPGMGIARLIDAGYDEARAANKRAKKPVQTPL